MFSPGQRFVLRGYQGPQKVLEVLDLEEWGYVSYRVTTEASETEDVTVPWATARSLVKDGSWVEI